MISWSSGTGDIGPTYFEIGGEQYVLELTQSAAEKGFMKKGEMKIWKKTRYEKMIEAKNHH